MEDVQVEREGLALDRIRDGFRNEEKPAQTAVSIATQLSTVDRIGDESVQFNSGEEFTKDDLSPTVTQLRRARKVAEIIEDETQVDIGHGKFAEAASTAGQLTSIVSITIAANNLLDASETLTEEYQNVNDAGDVSEETYDEFYRAGCIFILECLLFTTPINHYNYRLAWQGTRYVNNQYLYQLRELNSPLYRMTLSEVHYTIRGIVPRALHSSVDQVSQFLTWVGINTIEILSEHGDISAENIAGEVESVVEGFIELLRDVYEVPASIFDELDFTDIVWDIINHVRDGVDFSLPTTEEVVDDVFINPL
ncbi:hypothetical protein RH858_02465 [Halalkaliarchaeum sp. AArc-GB]|uniref:hypothetical protein n=1 Tax=Halalkaliarchaeum sp. AArc-GB TaxID=3074078 RepID=UPI002859864E|nr:hypothetical protein [Halalkaliarchaeum sp. AArc-GB]MDR5672020.1 hypothetical protein [Halalkaliarchaeum sp. AArc-GB]